MRFIFDGSPIKPFSTADSLTMEDGDIIDLVERVITTVATRSTLISLSRVDGEKPIVIAVEGDNEGDRVYYLMGRNTPLRNLMIDYCDCTGAFYEVMGFNYLGVSIDPDETADCMGWRMTISSMLSL
ncbi:hypothetical protein PTKIN_Ptkin16aG0031800 [Pterospermum kingtungense]